MINSAFHVHEQLACSCSLKGNKTGEDWVLKVNETFASLELGSGKTDKCDDG
jgi:hypothetical protein